MKGIKNFKIISKIFVKLLSKILIEFCNNNNNDNNQM